MKRLRFSVFMTLIAVIATSYTFAAVIYWQNPSAGFLQTSANWFPNTVPGEDDTISFAVAGTSVILANGDLSVAEISHGNGKITLDLDVYTIALSGNFTSTGAEGSSFNIESGKLAIENEMKIDGSTPAVFTISRSDSELDFKQGYVGFSYPGNKFIASDGAKITTADFFRIGHGGNSKNNTVIFDGEDTSFISTFGGNNRFFESGSDNKVCVSNGAYVSFSAAELRTAWNSNARNNIINIDGTGTVFSVKRLLNGNNGVSNLVHVSRGGTLEVRGEYQSPERTGTYNNLIVENACLYSPPTVVTSVVEEVTTYTTNYNASFNIKNPTTELILTGPETRADTHTVQLHSGKMFVLDEAVWTNRKTIAVGMANNPNSEMVISNAFVTNLDVTFNIGNNSTNCLLLVTAGSKIHNVGYFDITGTDSRMIIEGEGTYVHTGRGFRPNLSGHNASLHIRDGATAVSPSGFALEITRSSGTNNLVYIYNGGSLTNNGDIRLGHNSVNPKNNYLRVENGTIVCASSIYNQYENYIQIKGTNSLIQTKNLYLAGTSEGAIEFFPPENADPFTQPVIQVTNYTSINGINSRLLIDEKSARKCAVNGGGSYTILTNLSNNAITAEIPEENIFKPDEVNVVQTKYAIVVEIPDLSGTLLIVR
ncbi:MAG: hypothetical protein GX804_07855 [Lentisphaerae bacterium]|nr:hypothetical protein [Lentisphaerota bacterium]